MYNGTRNVPLRQAHFNIRGVSAMSFSHIVEPIRTDLDLFEEQFSSGFDTKVELLDTILQYVARHTGKRFRPALLFLIARMLGEVDKKAYDAAQIIELIHTATLIHDDVVDKAEKRRGSSSVNSVWGNQISVLIGDFLFAQALNRMILLNDHRINELIARVTGQLSKGELLDIQLGGNHGLSVANYFRMISDKTASLIAAASQIGAIVIGRKKVTALDQFWNFGYYLGCAYQIQDDLLDLIGDEKETGKPIGNDIKQTKITLPLIYAFQNSPPGADFISGYFENEKTDDFVARLRDFVIQTGGIEYAKKCAKEFAVKALSILSPYDESVYKSSLIELVHFAACRSA